MSMTISIDDPLKAEFTAVCRDMGISPSTAFGVFAKTVVRERRIPFIVQADAESERQARAYERLVNEGIRQGLDDIREGRTIAREEFEALRAARAEGRLS